MNKKTNLFILPLLVLSLSSCSFINFSFFSNKTSTAKIDSFVSYKTPSYDSTAKTSNLTLRNISKSFGKSHLPSTGNSRILVIPYEFTDAKFTYTDLAKIENAFFGSSKDTGWESVSSFYNKSSYGKLNISGEVTPKINSNMTVSQFEILDANATRNNETLTDTILDQCLDLLIKNGMDLSSYDSDNDGYIDAVWIVYSADYNQDSDSLWAYTTWTYSEKKHSNLYSSCYAWASVKFLNEYNYGVGTKSGDAHTFIHETGHMLGLDDYYSYDYDGLKNYDTPLGGVDMMDFNIVDHNSYSKYLLGWITPTLITEEYLKANNNVLTLSSLVESGKAFLLPAYKDGSIAYNGTPFDEYLLLEYYTPTNLNENDSLKKYTNGLQGYNSRGLLVYHVNSTVGKVVAKNGDIVWNGEVYDKLPDYSREWGNSYAFSILFSNSNSYSYTYLDDSKSNFYRTRLISLLPAIGYKIEGKKTGYSGNSSLFKKNVSFKSVYDNFVFDDGSNIQFNFEMTSSSSNDCSIKFTKI